MPQSMCWDPICTVAEVWRCSEHYLWLFVGGFLLEGYTAVYCYCPVFFLRLLKLRKLAVCKLDVSRGASYSVSWCVRPWNLRWNIPLSPVLE